MTCVQLLNLPHRCGLCIPARKAGPKPLLGVSSQNLAGALAPAFFGVFRMLIAFIALVLPRRKVKDSVGAIGNVPKSHRQD